jgi:hypothetical protein
MMMRDNRRQLNQILEDILQTSEWKHFGDALNTDERDKLNNSWHRLDGKAPFCYLPRFNVLFELIQQDGLMPPRVFRH